MAKILIIAEHRSGKLKKSTLELVSAASQSGNETHVALLGEAVDNFKQDLNAHGAAKIHLAQSSALKFYSAEAYSQICAQIIQSVRPNIVLASHTPTGKDLMPHLSALLDAGLASDCTSLSFSGEKIVARKPLYAGKATAEVEFLDSGLQMATIRPNALGAPKQAQPTPTLEVINIAVSLSGQKTNVKDVVQGNTGRPDVTEAAIVISGGRSLKSADGFKILEELADVVGGAVGASRAAVDAGFRPHRDQVGQTGKVVSPSLYIACGISGAIQHLAGMRTSKVIVAINTDPEAPIFQAADYGVVCDLFSLVPLLTQEFRKIRES
mgnify:CR=1 FL=1